MLTSDNPLAAHSASGDELTQLQRELLQRFPKSNAPLNGLSEWLLDQRNLQAAWSRVASTPGANTPGPDGPTCSEIEARRDRWLKQLREDLQQRAFQPQAARLIDMVMSFAWEVGSLPSTSSCGNGTRSIAEPTTPNSSSARSMSTSNPACTRCFVK